MRKSVSFSTSLRGGLIAGLLAGPLYVVGLGPAMLLWNLIPNPPIRSTLARLYDPLERWTDGTPFKTPLLKYAGWWASLSPARYEVFPDAPTLPATLEP